jgi:hypothetical protein
LITGGKKLLDHVGHLGGPLTTSVGRDAQGRSPPLDVHLPPHSAILTSLRHTPDPALWGRILGSDVGAAPGS